MARLMLTQVFISVVLVVDVSTSAVAFSWH